MDAVLQEVETPSDYLLSVYDAVVEAVKELIPIFYLYMYEDKFDSIDLQRKVDPVLTKLNIETQRDIVMDFVYEGADALFQTKQESISLI